MKNNAQKTFVIVDIKIAGFDTSEKRMSIEAFDSVIAGFFKGVETGHN